MKKKNDNNGKELNFEAKLWQAADKMRNNMDAAEYKHVVLGLIFLKYISDAFSEIYQKLSNTKGADAEDADEYRAENIFYVPKKARWDYLQKNAKQPTIGKLIDDAMDAIEKDNITLKGVLPKNYAREGLDKQRLGELIDLIGTIGLGDKENRSKDILGRVYEYFLGQFADAEGKKGGQFYTPRSIVRLLVEMLEPYKGRVFDPCCGSGGMFVQSEKFVQAQGGRIGDISIYGQESNQTTWRLCKMNLAIRGIDANIAWNNEGSFLNDAHKDLKADFVIANPPFNDSDWSGDMLREDHRWEYGTPPEGNANFAWVQHFIYHLNPKGKAGIVLANGASTSKNKQELEIRKNLVERSIVDCIVSLPAQLFYNTPIQAMLWFFNRERIRKSNKNEVLFIDARNLGKLEDRTHKIFDAEDIKTVSETYKNWKLGTNYKDKYGFCKSVPIEELKRKDYKLATGLYVGFINKIDKDSEKITLQKISEKTINGAEKSKTLVKKIEAFLIGFGIKMGNPPLEFLNSNDLIEILLMYYKKIFVNNGRDNKKDLVGNYIKFVKGKKPGELFIEKKEGLVQQILIETFERKQSFYVDPKNMVKCNLDDILMVMDGGSSGRVEIGYSGVIGSTIAKIRIINPSISSAYLYCFLKYKEEEINFNTTGTSIPHTDKDLIESFDIAIPDSDNLAKFTEMATLILELVNIKNRIYET